MKTPIDINMPIPDIMREYGVSQATAYLARKRGYITGARKAGRPATRPVQGLRLPNADIMIIARHTARHLARREYDLQQEIIQGVLIELWTSGIADKALAYTAAKRAGLNIVRAWRNKRSTKIPTVFVSYADWLADYESDGLGNTDMDDVEE